MKNVLNKMLAALVIAASAASLCAPAYAEEAPVLAEEAYTVTEDEQTVTIEFNEPIVLSCVESYAGDEAEEDDGIMPCATMSTDAIGRAYWGAYISADDKYYVSITSGTHVTIRIKYPSYGECYCSGDNVSCVYFDPMVSGSENFTVEYSCYTKVNESTQNVLVNSPAKIGGQYHQNYTHPYFTINSITLNKA